ncbi:phycobiliprotein lyase [Waterburya agarophytonicola K14]|uniref:Chromophore lyase CpcS/CpeS n=1 Tax=Waterburya agarophytonicola KI4 TaxID=2874699 RepID=A0A964BYC1_9CYAN|nr:phycobiliprotein lyase [Waterburya agarophytonicola]MCC0179702.1 phycobiliprotein lyase [Waterburya agarophytonicola KI4]
MVLAQTANIALQSLVVNFFRKSAGNWNSQRRYYSLDKNVAPQEVESKLKISFLEQGSRELVELAQSHELENPEALICGTKVTWESNYTNKNSKPVIGSTVFGIEGNILYRDRGFATPKPITAVYSFTNLDTMSLRTEYNSNVFEEEIKLVGSKYRTRQTIISRAGQEITIGQYLEKRI